MSIYKKLAEIQAEIKGLGQDKQGNGYKYVTGNKVINAIKPLMIEKNLLLKQEVLEIENQRMDYQVSLVKENGQWNGKPKSEILTKLKLKFTWIDVETGEKDENLFAANGQNDWEKGLGSALTYAERYFLLKYFHIATDEDDIDNPERKKKQIEQLQKSVSSKFMELEKERKEKMLAYFKVGDLSEMSLEQLEDAEGMLNAIHKKK